jgi:hypothetical protein
MLSVLESFAVTVLVMLPLLVLVPGVYIWDRLRGNPLDYTPVLRENDTRDQHEANSSDNTLDRRTR